MQLAAPCRWESETSRAEVKFLAVVCYRKPKLFLLIPKLYDSYHRILLHRKIKAASWEAARVNPCSGNFCV
jgi:hypothetical protein